MSATHNSGTLGVSSGYSHPGLMLAWWTLTPGTPIPTHPTDIPSPRARGLIPGTGLGLPCLKAYIVGSPRVGGGNR